MEYYALDGEYIRKRDCAEMVIVALDKWLDQHRHTPEAYDIVNEILDLVEERCSYETEATKQETLDYDLINDSTYIE